MVIDGVPIPGFVLASTRAADVSAAALHRSNSLSYKSLRRHSLMKSKFLVFALVLLCTGAAFAQDWAQWGYDKAHSSQVPYVGQALNQNLVNTVYDPLVPQEMSEVAPYVGEPALLAHYQAPLVDSNDVYMMFKGGTYSIHNYGTQQWGERKYSWSGGTLVTQWSFNTDWTAPGSFFNDFWEPVFHPALANGSLYVPGK